MTLRVDDGGKKVVRGELYDVGSSGNEPNAGKPLAKREPTTREKIILLESSKLNGNVCPPWTAPKVSDFNTAPFVDVQELSLSDIQLEVFAGWRRAGDLLMTLQTERDQIPASSAGERADLVQDVTTDCSVVASLCAANARANARSVRVKGDVLPYHVQSILYNS